eukprot:9098016-Alexandrium_andersonii.AAC.1
MAHATKPRRERWRAPKANSPTYATAPAMDARPSEEQHPDLSRATDPHLTHTHQAKPATCSGRPH